MLATPANMKRLEDSGDHSAVALDLETGETYSATSGDYFWQAPYEPLTSEHDGATPLVLAHHIEYYEPIEGEDATP